MNLRITEDGAARDVQEIHELLRESSRRNFLHWTVYDKHDQNKGVGSNIIGDVCNYLGQLGYRKVRIGVDKGNPQSNSFWKKNGFHMISKKEYHVMELAL